MALVALSGCSATLEGLKADTYEARKNISEFIAPEDKGGGAPHAKPKKPYCYKTLGRIDCYEKPVPGAEARISGDGNGDDYSEPRVPVGNMTAEEKPLPKINKAVQAHDLDGAEVKPASVTEGKKPAPEIKPAKPKRPNVGLAAPAPAAKPPAGPRNIVP